MLRSAAAAYSINLFIFASTPDHPANNQSASTQAKQDHHAGFWNRSSAG